MSDDTVASSIQAALLERFGEQFRVDPKLPGLRELAQIAGYRSHRRYLPGPIEPDLLRLLCACALSAPSKSDLQQADILVGDLADRRIARLADVAADRLPVEVVGDRRGRALVPVDRILRRPELQRPDDADRDDDAEDDDTEHNRYDAAPPAGASSSLSHHTPPAPNRSGESFMTASWRARAANDKLHRATISGEAERAPAQASARSFRRRPRTSRLCSWIA